MPELKLKVCSKCNNLVRIINNSNITCCGETMQDVIPNQNIEIKEKHIPNYEKVGDKLVVSVKHVMEDDHYIEWIIVQGKNTTYEKQLLPHEDATFTVPFEKGAYLYSYCNKHGLWKNEVK